MFKKRLILGLFAGIIALYPLGAANVSFLVMETGMNADDPNGNYSALWENNLLDVFFDMGHIVSNSLKIQISQKPAGDFPAEARRDYTSAREGGMDYFIIAIVDYKAPNVSLRLFNTKSSNMITEQKYAISSFRNTKDENESIKKAVAVMAARLK